MHTAGVSVRGKMSGTEETIRDEDLEDYLCDWPMEVPMAAKRKKVAGGKDCWRGKSNYL